MFFPLPFREAAGRWEAAGGQGQAAPAGQVPANQVAFWQAAGARCREEWHGVSSVTGKQSGSRSFPRGNLGGTTGFSVPLGKEEPFYFLNYI